MCTKDNNNDPLSDDDSSVEYSVKDHTGRCFDYKIKQDSPNHEMRKSQPAFSTAVKISLEESVNEHLLPMDGRDNRTRQITYNINVDTNL